MRKTPFLRVFQNSIWIRISRFSPQAQTSMQRHPQHKSHHNKPPPLGGMSGLQTYSQWCNTSALNKKLSAQCNLFHPMAMPLVFVWATSFEVKDHENIVRLNLYGACLSWVWWWWRGRSNHPSDWRTDHPLLRALVQHKPRPQMRSRRYQQFLLQRRPDAVENCLKYRRNFLIYRKL